ncbi:MAG: hypothetical protein HC806_04200 [Anaerolineae bacterium]|nr:hypothetical protein [Anaerolineae bacterium]
MRSRRFPCREEKGVGEFGWVGTEEVVGFPSGGDAAIEENLAGDGAVAAEFGICFGGDGGGELPAFGELGHGGSFLGRDTK